MTTRWMEIAVKIRDRIVDGTYPAGTKIPAIPALMKEFGVARDTVRDAVSRLTNEGLVTPLRGVGTVVRDVTPVALAYQATSPAQVWAAQTGGGPDSDRVVFAERTTADRDIASTLAIDETAEVVHRIRHQSKGQQIAQIHEQWIPGTVADAIQSATGDDLSDADHEQSTDLFSQMRAAGRPPVDLTETLLTRMPDPEESATLELPPGVPVLMTYRVTRDGEKQPVETSTFTGAGDRMSQSFTVELDKK